MSLFLQKLAETNLFLSCDISHLFSPSLVYISVDLRQDFVPSSTPADQHVGGQASCLPPCLLIPSLLQLIRARRPRPSASSPPLSASPRGLRLRAVDRVRGGAPGALVSDATSARLAPTPSTTLRALSPSSSAAKTFPASIGVLAEKKEVSTSTGAWREARQQEETTLMARQAGGRTRTS
eukprot:754762-Hanusia_phi.AAC.1